MKIPDIVLVAPITDISGTAEAARNLYLALFDMGIKVKLVEIPFWSHLKADLSPEVGEKLQIGFDRNDLNHPAVIHYYPPHAVQQVPVIGGAAFNVSYTVFETDKCPLVWRDSLNSDFFIENWVASNFQVDAYAGAGIDKKKLRRIPQGVDIQRFNPNVEPMPIEGKTAFSFMTALDWSHRKNPEAMVTAFLQEFNNNPEVCFAIKAYTGYGDEDSKNKIRSVIRRLRMMTRSKAKILLVTDFLHSDIMPNFHRAANAWVNLSRGEGWDMGALQSMACGIPVIGTDNTAHSEYMTNDNGYPVKSTKTLITDKNFLARNPQFIDHSWGEVDIKNARAQMRQAYNDSKNGKLEEKGKKARETALNYKWQISALQTIFHLGKYFN